jgi:hypothetical protein
MELQSGTPSNPCTTHARQYKKKNAEPVIEILQNRRGEKHILTKYWSIFQISDRI